MKKEIICTAGLLLFATSPCYAVDSYTIDGKNFSYKFDVYNEGDSVVIDEEDLSSPFTILSGYRDSMFTAGKTWADIVRQPSFSDKPVNYFIFALDDYNASASSPYVTVEGNPYMVTYVNASINNLTVIGPEEVEEIPFNGYMNIGLGTNEEYPGWSVFSGYHSLYHGEMPELYTVMMHEIMHSLGVSSNVGQYKEDQGDKTYYFTENDDDPLSIFDKDLRVYTGTYGTGFDEDLEIVPESGMGVGEDEDFDVYKYTPYYVGENTLKVLSGENDYDDARQAIADNVGLANYSAYYDAQVAKFNIEYPRAYGLPIHNLDTDEDGYEVDLSHIELRNSFMSHQSFRNWLVPMEAELALLKDIGYDIDLRRHFGQSYYLDNIVDTYTGGYSEWNGNTYTGAPSTVNQGVGIHIYGNNNEITQDSDILSSGEGAIGVRIDGVENTYTLAGGNSIQTSGKDSLGIAVTWGKNHVVNVESGATVEASGEEGIAASFDFGVNMFGLIDDSRGSYINYSDVSSGNVDPHYETTDSLIKEFNVYGTLTGEKAAVYISDNAHVKNINIYDGAEINGDIISEWNSVKSGKNASVLMYYENEWYVVNPDDEDQIYFTDLNVYNASARLIDGNINGENGTYNTLKMNNYADLTVTGNELLVHSLHNEGNLNVDDINLAVTDGEINGDGVMNVSKGLAVSENIENIENIVNMAHNSFFSSLNGTKQDISINQINTDDTEISFDLGDTFDLQNASTSDTAQIKQIGYDVEMAEQIEDGVGVKLFEDENVVLDLGDSSASIYYDGKKYTFWQSDEDMSVLVAELTAEDVELGDALEDETAANYVVTEDVLTKDAGTVKGDEFEISGNDVDVNGNHGILIDKNQNNSGTTLMTGIWGASDSNLTVINGGDLEIDAKDKEITVGREGENAITLDNGTVEMDASENDIIIAGDIIGSNNQTDKIKTSGGNVTFANIQDVAVSTGNETVNIEGTSQNTVWKIKADNINVSNDDYLASDGSNEIVFDGGELDLANDKASDITLSGLTLNENLSAVIDVDLKTLSADRFVFESDSDLQTNGKSLVISEINLLNDDAVLSAEKYAITVAGSEFNSEALAGNVEADVEASVLSPIFKYDLGFENTMDESGFILSRGKASHYDSYNPAVTIAPVAALTGGYLSQLNSYNEAFQNTDTRAQMLYGSSVGGMSSGDEISCADEKPAVWLRPYGSSDKVKLKHGPKVRNKMYGAFVGADSKVYMLQYGWEAQYSLYAGYNGSSQRYDGNKIRQHGGNIGVTGAWYKKNFFTALTANAGASDVRGNTMYGHDDFYMLMAGLASKSGYNWMLASGKFTVQPNYLMSYTVINGENYTNAAGVRIKFRTIQAFNIAPGIKSIYNFENGWQPYISAQMVWTVTDSKNFKAQEVYMPDMSVRPYVQYGIGCQKNWNDKLSVYGQFMQRNGGQRGVAAGVGLRWALN